MKLLDSILALVLKFFSMMVAVLLPVHSVMISVSVLVIADLITGIWASKKEGSPITSKGLKKTIVKTLAYQSTIVVAFVLETYLLQDVPVVKTVAGLIGLTEGKSFFENIHRITGLDFWSVALKKIHQATSVLPEDKR